MSYIAEFDTAFRRCPLIAILRGVQNDEVVAIGESLLDAGFELIEVPLNSPNALKSVTLLAEALKDRAVIGAGTVLRRDDVSAVLDAGGKLVVAPNMSVDVIASAARLGMVSLPGIATPSEAFTALEAGASAIKLFPAEGSNPAVLKAMRVVLPSEVRVLPVGGITPENLTPWVSAGADGFGLASALYKPGFAPQEVGRRARQSRAAMSSAQAAAV